MVLFRAVSLEELRDIRRSGQLRAVASSCEGKHFACSLEHASRWGKAFYGNASFVIVRVEVSDDLFASLTRWERLDGIGAACFATIEELPLIRIVEVYDES